ncbi:endolytic transglycosylase MltG [Alteribacillus sp. JSM 102045]|uniref:endolytic transglycosylase MltG n=1 Tax=Alteribacillus sp. JSM 102045 TaxID=1562101 RepID=UPI0035C12A1F
MSKDNSKDPLEERVKQAKIIRKIVLIVIAVIALVIIGVGIGGYIYITSSLKPVDEGNEETVEVEIPIGSSSSSIGQILEEEGVIKNGTIFRYYVTYKNEKGFQAGTYELSPSMDINEIIRSLKEGTVIQEPELTFIIPEGTWYDDIITRIAKETPYEEEEIEEQLEDEEYLKELIERYEILDEDILQSDVRYPLEGYLFPARYDFEEEKPAISVIIEQMIERMEENVVKFSEQLEASDYSVHDLLTLASIVEREAQRQEDRPIIAGVLFNRLEEGMRLEVDPTVAYAIGEHKYMTSFEDLETDSPYNTYRYEGLPPGPIASPGADSIKAVMIPNDNDYIYFYARQNGEVIYNEDYDEHRKTQETYRSEWEEAEETE